MPGERLISGTENSATRPGSEDVAGGEIARISWWARRRRTTALRAEVRVRVRAGETAWKRRRRIWWRSIAVVVAVAMAWTSVSYVEALTAPGTDPVAARTAEWLRDHGLGGVLNWAENWWYTHNPPPTGGTPPGGLPTAEAPVSHVAVGPMSEDANLGLPLAPPVNMAPFVHAPLSNEGVWQPTGREVSGFPAVYTAFMRPDSIHTSLVAGFMWMDTQQLKAVFVPGLNEPAGAPQRYGAEIPEQLRRAVVAAFNSAFRLADSRGGLFDHGVQIRRLVPGQASFVITKDGTADVVAWGHQPRPDAHIETVRQNLALLIDHGVPAPHLNSQPTAKWGGTLANKVLAWRSGVGVDRNGALIYIAGPGLSVNQLANLFVRAGAVRAMTLDINQVWDTAYIYHQTEQGTPGTIQGTKLLPDMQRPGDRYLQPGERDFFAMIARS